MFTWVEGFKEFKKLKIMQDFKGIQKNSSEIRRITLNSEELNFTWIQECKKFKDSKNSTKLKRMQNTLNEFKRFHVKLEELNWIQNDASRFKEF